MIDGFDVDSSHRTIFYQVVRKPGYAVCIQAREYSTLVERAHAGTEASHWHVTECHRVNLTPRSFRLHDDYRALNQTSVKKNSDHRANIGRDHSHDTIYLPTECCSNCIKTSSRAAAHPVFLSRSPQSTNTVGTI